MCAETFAISSSYNHCGGWRERKKNNKGVKEITLFKRNSRLQISSDAQGLDHIFLISLLRAEDITKLKTL